MRRSTTVCVLAALALGACGSQAPLPRSCVEATGGDVRRALRAAPGHVALADGTLLSTCAHRAVDDAGLHAVGVSFTSAATELAAEVRGSDAAAIQLGYLVGAAERGTRRTAGVQDQLVGRIADVAGFAPGAEERSAAIERGRAAGRRGG